MFNFHYPKNRSTPLLRGKYLWKNRAKKTYTIHQRDENLMLKLERPNFSKEDL